VKYYPLAPPISTASQIMLNDFKYAGHTIFENSLDIFTIQKETSFGSKVFEDIDVRLTSVINPSTGTKYSDDWKQLIFDPMGTFIPKMGTIFFFDSNYWLCTFTDNIKSVLTNVVVRRCNEQLRWIDSSGFSYSEFCCVDYELTGVRNLDRQDDLSLPQGYISIYSQLNERTELIKPNQRFLFGRPANRVCWRVFGNGIQSSQNLETLDDTSGRLLTLTVGGYQINPETDDLVNGIADAYKLVYTINLSASSISGNVGEIHPLGATLEANGNPTSGLLTYTTSASTVATINTSGSVTLIASGSAVATALMGGNPTITASALVTVTASGTTTNEVRVTPSDNVEILESDTQIFTVYLYTNGIQQANVFTFAPTNANVPTDHYIMITNNNGFSLENVEKYLDLPLIITATSGSYTKQISITLNGAF
jgi:hypothetical protein